MMFVEVDEANVEYAWFYPATPDGGRGLRAPIVFLHHGFGNVLDWGDFPKKVADTAGCPAVLYSRRGCGGSSPLSAPRDQAYLHDEAYRFLPALLDALGVDRCHLYGHSDGATIALLFASAFPDRTLASVVEAPHVFAETVTLEGVAVLAARYEQEPALRGKLATGHSDPQGAFHAWAKPWLSPEFRNWTIVNELLGLKTPLLVIQGSADPFGTIAHARLIAARAIGATRVIEIPDGGHNPHRRMESLMIQLAGEYIRDHAEGPGMGLANSERLE